VRAPVSRRAPGPAVVTAGFGRRASLIRGPDDISGEVAIVTGASRGLGLALARQLASGGNHGTA
jgi:hypothetical protein